MPTDLGFALARVWFDELAVTGSEGLVVKDLDGPYRTGGRGPLGACRRPPVRRTRHDVFMTDDVQGRLRDVILILFDAVHRSDDGDPDDLVELLGTVNDVARAAASAAGYLPQRAADTTQPQAFGRELQPHELRTFGITAVLHGDPAPETITELAHQLASYLAGPTIACEQIVVTDARLDLTGTHTVAGWQLTCLHHDDVQALTPLPITRGGHRRPFDDALVHGGCTVLRRQSATIVPAASHSSLFDGLTHDLFEPELTFPAWAPLLLLNLVAAERVITVAEYEVEPARWVRRIRGDGLGMTIDGDDQHEWEIPAWGPCRLSATETTNLLHGVATLSPYLEAFAPPPGLSEKALKARQKPENRIRRSAHRLLAQGPRLGIAGDAVFPRDRADLLFSFTAALENLMTPNGEREGLSRMVSQRTAVLIGESDDDRVTIQADVAAAYGLRSRYAHGDEIPSARLTELTVLVYGYLRETLRTLIILGPQFNISDAGDAALLSAGARQQITAAVATVVATLPAPNRRLRLRPGRDVVPDPFA